MWCSRSYFFTRVSLFSSFLVYSSPSFSWRCCLPVFWHNLFSLPSWPCILLYEVTLPWLTGVLRVKRVWDSSSFPHCFWAYCVGGKEQEKTSKHQQRRKAQPSQPTNGRRPLTDNSHTKTQLLITTHMLECFIWTQTHVTGWDSDSWLPISPQLRETFAMGVSEQDGEEDRTPAVMRCLWR